jgi:hypothetical protein
MDDWKVAEYTDEEIEIIRGKEVHIAFFNNDPEGRKNARVAVAAPAMKKALELVREIFADDSHLRRFPGVWAVVDKALAGTTV